MTTEAAAAEAPTATPAPAAAAPAAPAPAAETVLSAVTAQPAPADWIPEKFRVRGDGDAIDLVASARKIEEHRSHLEKRLGAGDVPPKSADEYKVTVPQEFAEAFKPESDPMLAEFRAEAHKAGLTQTQFDFALGEFFKRAPALIEQQVELKNDECQAELRKTWTDEETFRKQTSAAVRAVKTYAGEDAQTIINRYGNDPVIVRMLARMGAEVKEDTPPAEAATAGLDITKRIAELQDEIPKLPRGDGRRAALQAELEGLFQRSVKVRKAA